MVAKKNNKASKLKIIIGNKGIAKRMSDRLLDIDVSDMRFYIAAITTVMQKRIYAGVPIVIDNFGTLVRVKYPPKESFNVVTRKPFIHTPMCVNLIINQVFLDWIKQPENRRELINKIVMKSEEYKKQNGGDKCLKLI